MDIWFLGAFVLIVLVTGILIYHTFWYMPDLQRRIGRIERMHLPSTGHYGTGKHHK